MLLVLKGFAGLQRGGVPLRATGIAAGLAAGGLALPERPGRAATPPAMQP
jgi:hypothetical protein